MRDNNSTTIVGGDHNGGIYNGPTTVCGSDVPRQEYDVKWMRRLPLTQSWLGIIAAVLGIAGTGAFGKALHWLWQGSPWRATQGDEALQVTTRAYPWVLAFLALLALAGCALAGWRMARKRLMTPSRFSGLPVLAGVDGKRRGGQLALVRLGGRCVRCHGRLRFYGKAMGHEEWADGRRKFVVDHQRPVVECVRNPAHCWELDISDRLG